MEVNLQFTSCIADLNIENIAKHLIIQNEALQQDWMAMCVKQEIKEEPIQIQDVAIKLL